MIFDLLTSEIYYYAQAWCIIVVVFAVDLFLFFFWGGGGPQRKKTCLRGFANNTGTDQPAHPRSLISAFVIRYLKSMICKLATVEISKFYLVSVADETGLKLPLSEAPKAGFVATRPVYDSYALPFQFIWGPKQLSVCHAVVGIHPCTFCCDFH